MMLIKILLKSVFHLIVFFFNYLLRFSRTLSTDGFFGIGAFFPSKVISNNSELLLRKFFSISKDQNSLIFHNFVLHNNENIFLLRLLCFILRINFDKNSEILILKKFNISHENLKNQGNTSETPGVIKHQTLQSLSNTFENMAVSASVNAVFNSEKIYYDKSIENVFVHNNINSFNFLTKDSSIGINFNALQDFYNYLKLFDYPEKLTNYPLDSAYPVPTKVKKKSRIPKNFRGGRLANKNFLHKSYITEETLRKQINTLKQVEFLLKNRQLLETQRLKWQDLNINHEVKKVMFSYYNPSGTYGNDAVLYTGDVSSKNKTMAIRRINLTQDLNPVNNLGLLKQKVGFFNFNASEEEEWENSSDVPFGGWFTGEFYFINPFLILGFIFYSFLELFFLIYFMSFFFSNPYDTFRFFLKYPLVYFYENLTVFPSPNYFFSALIFWFSVIFIFYIHLLQLIDEERFDPPNLSWVYNFFKDFLYIFLIGWCGLFCIFEILSFCDLMLTRVFFVGIPGYPNLLATLFLIFYDIFSLLGTTGYFAFYLENFLSLDVKFPVLYFSDYTFLSQRYPLIQPYFFGNPYLDRPNFFLWLIDHFLNIVSGDAKKMSFFAKDSRFIFQRELIQDVRKYNYIRKNLMELRFIGQLHSRGWNGFNYRLDLQTLANPIIPSEQVIRFDWRFKNTHSNGIHSRLFQSINFGFDSSKNSTFKTISLFRGRRNSYRYGYLDYLKSIYLDSQKSLSWDSSKARRKKRKFINNLPIGARKSFYQKKPIKTFFFQPTHAKFSLMVNENRPIRTKSDRNFRHSRLFRNFWSYLPGNAEPRKYYNHKPFVSVENFANIDTKLYSKIRFFFKTSSNDKNELKLMNLGKYSLRNIFLDKPAALFPTQIVDEKAAILNTKNNGDFKDWKNYRKNNSIKKFVNHEDKIFFKNRPKRSYSLNSSIDSNFVAEDPEFSKNQKKHKDLSSFLDSSDVRGRAKMKNRHLRKKKINIASIPDFAFQPVKKTRFISKIFQNFEPKFFLRPTASFTTFSKLGIFEFSQSYYSHFSGFSYPLSSTSGFVYPFSLLFLGFGKLLNANFPVKFIGFDYYYSQNHNFFYSLFDNYLKQYQFQTLPTAKSRFKHPLRGGFRHSLDFLYPMLSELRLKEKLVPIDFFYTGPSVHGYTHLRLDPYESVRNSSLTKGHCYFLDTRIQNWLNFNNVIWNDYFHFFFNRSYKTEGNGSKFCLASFNPLLGPSSYKLFIASSTLETPRIGQYFYNFIPWLQYKFKWLLYPTSTYKRFDSFRSMQQHSNKKFYFTSLLKFYQMNLFRWQQAAQISQWNQIQSRNFLIHLFFHKYKLLAELSDLKNIFHKLSIANNSKLNFPPVNSVFSFIPVKKLPNSVEKFNSGFFAIDNLHSNNNTFNSNLRNEKNYDKSFHSQVYIPSFTVHDFRFFQYVTDLRRWKGLQTSYVRDWKFEKYVKYLGPLLYKDDVPSLMGFFAPFEYRNQIFTSRMRNDSLRFSVFFPKKVTDEQFNNPLKRFSFPPQKFFSNPSKFQRKLNSSKPMYYAFVINRPFLLSGSNYSFFSRKGKKLLTGFYPHLQRFNLNSDFNVTSGQGFFDSLSLHLNTTFNDLLYGNNTFVDFGSKKKKLLKDKLFWLSKSYELQEIKNRLIKNSFDSKEKGNLKNFKVILDQFGKPLDLQLPTSIPRLEFTKEGSKIVGLIDFNSWKSEKMLKILSNERNKQYSFLSHLYPDIFMRFGGAKANSFRWHMGQSWMKFVVASQNVGVYPVPSEKRAKVLQGRRPKGPLERVVFSRLASKGLKGIPFQTRFMKASEIREKHGFFNFGLSGIGRLPRLSRSFFHMLFFRNKLDDFKNLKISFLKIYLMSVPLFHHSDFETNSSFRLFWSFLLGYQISKFSFLNFKYSFFFNLLQSYCFNPDFSSVVYAPWLGTLFNIYSNTFITDENILLLHAQYHNFKAYNRFVFFSQINAPSLYFDSYVDEVYSNKRPLLSFYYHNLSLVRNNFFLFRQFLFPFPLFSKFVNSLNDLFTNFSFKIFNQFFINSVILNSLVDNSLLYLNKNDKEFNKSFDLLYKFDKFSLFELTHNSNYFLRNKLVDSQDFFRFRLFFGSFRSQLHWYHYHVHYFFLLQHFISDSVLNFFFDSMKMGMHMNVKYSNLFNLNLSTYLMFLNKNRLFHFFSFSDNIGKLYFSQYTRKLKMSRDSNFIQAFSNIYSLFFSLHHSQLLIRLNFRFSNNEFLKKLYLFQNVEESFHKNFITYNSFFFNTGFLYSFSHFGNSLNYGNSVNSVSFVNVFEAFSDDLFQITVRIDGSGRHNRPKRMSQTLDKIFTYREYEKYRREHHRQRFRSVSPHWIQNSFKNRTNFRYYYRSPDKKKRVLTRRSLSKMFKYLHLDRSKFNPKRLNRISFSNYLNGEFLLRSFLGRNTQLDNPMVSKSVDLQGKDNSTINFVDTLTLLPKQDDNVATQQRVLLSKVRLKHNNITGIVFGRKFKHSAFPDFNNLSTRRPKMIQEYLEKALLPEFNATRPKDKPRWSVEHSHNNFAFVPYKRLRQELDLILRKQVPLLVPSIDTELFMEKSKTQHFKRFKDNSKKDIASQVFSGFSGSKQEKTISNIDFSKSAGFYPNGGNFVNTKNLSSVRNLFQSPTSYNTGHDNIFFSPDREQKKHFNRFNNRFDYQHQKASLKESLTEPFYRISPRSLLISKPRKKIHGLLKNSVGGIPASAHKNKYIYPGLLNKDKLRKNHLKNHISKYPPNVKRFVRSNAKVVMHIPYLYSKWFTQNPRLSFSVDTNLLDVFINNQYDEFNYICVQSLFLLKRKIMFNIINLKLVSHKHKILYFLNLNDGSFKQTEVIYAFSENFKNLVFYFQSLLKNFNIAFDFNLIFVFIYQLRNLVLKFFFKNDFFYVRLLHNPLISKFKHDSDVSSDLLFFEDFYYKQTSKRILSQIAFLGHSTGGWNNPLGIAGQYIPGLNFYVKGAIHFNFNYQYPDFFSGRYFSPEILLDNNVVRQNSELFDRNFFFNEFSVSKNYRRAWHFISYRIQSPISPFIEYERPHSLIFQRNIKHKQRRLPLMSLRRVYNIYPNHLSSFFSTLITDSATLVGHDTTLPLKLKLLNFKLKENPFYRRQLNYSFKNGLSQINYNVRLLSQSLKSKQLSVLAEFHNRMNLSPLVNKRRLGLRRSNWSPFRYNSYYKFNWHTFLHKFYNNDSVGYRRYKLSPYFDLYQGGVTLSLKLRALQHLIISQIPRFEIDSRRRVPLNMSSKEFTLLFFHYFSYVNNNFADKGYNSLSNKILKYVNRKVYPFLGTYVFERNKDFPFFWSNYENKKRRKILANEENFYFSKKLKKVSRKLPNYTSIGLYKSLEHTSNKLPTSFVIPNHLGKEKNNNKYSKIIFNIRFLIFSEFKHSVNYFISSKFLWLTHGSILNLMLERKTNNKLFQSSNFAFLLRKFANVYRFQPYFLQTLSRGFFKLYGNYDFVKLLSDLRFFKKRWSRYNFLFQFTQRASQRNLHVNSTNYAFRKYSQWFFITQLFYPRESISRIFGIHTLFNIKKHRERFLNPGAWLGFDLFSRVRPAFRPFLFKFSKHFMFSKIIPSKGIPSYNAFIKSHTAFDNYFERHPYISFSIGLGSTNDLISSEGVYKELKKRSQMLDFARRHYKNASPSNHMGSSLKQRNFYSYNMFSGIERKRRRKFDSKRKYAQFLQQASEQFLTSRLHGFDIDPIEGPKYIPKPGAKVFMTAYDANYPRKRLRRINTMPLSFRYNGIFKNSNYYAVMAKPRRKLFFLNTKLMRPYGTFLKFVRSDNYFSRDLGLILGSVFQKYCSLNLNNHSRFRSYYQPNLKLFFDFNAYKQRYNLGLLFRDLSFEQDFQLFLFKKMKFFPSEKSLLSITNDSNLLTSFVTFSLVDYFNFVMPNSVMFKGYLGESKFSQFCWLFEKFILKLNPSYMFLIFLDFYLMILFSLFSFFNFFDFSFFVNLFEIDDNFVYYIKKRPIFQIFFHVAFFKEYLKFSWLFSLKFLIFNIEYYPYYFLIFSFLLIMRTLSFNIQKSTRGSPFLVPYVWRFSDLRINPHNGWFDSAWQEIKSDALLRLKDLHSSNSIQFDYEYLLKFEDIKRARRRYQLKSKKNFFEPDDSKTDLTKYDNILKTDDLFSVPLSIIKLKGLFSKFGTPSFILPSKDLKNSDGMKLLDIDQSQRSFKLLSFDKKSDSSTTNASFEIQKKSKLSFFFLQNQFYLLFTGRISFSKFFNDFIAASKKVSDKKIFINNYDVEDFGEEFTRLFIDPSSEFNSLINNRDLKHHRMLPDDENILFYRKPGSILQSEIMSRKYGTESDQLHYIVEFPGKFNNSYVNTFSKLYSIRNLNYNKPYYGFFSFPKNTKLPTTFEEFVIFCSSEQSNLRLSSSMTNKPADLTLEPKLSRMKELWSLFQYVTKYEYNMFNEHNMDDVRLFDSIFEQHDRYTLLDNFKFWVNKASTDAIDFNFWNRNFFLIRSQISNDEINMQGSDSKRDDQDQVENSLGIENDAAGTVSPFFSLFYIFYIYLILFIFFVFISLLFCFFFLFIISLYNYVSFFF